MIVQCSDFSVTVFSITAYCQSCWQQELSVACSCIQCHQWRITRRKQTCNAGLLPKNLFDFSFFVVVNLLLDFEYFVNLCLQEFMILPVGASSFKEAMKMGVEVYHHLKVCTVGFLILREWEMYSLRVFGNVLSSL